MSESDEEDRNNTARETFDNGNVHGSGIWQRIKHELRGTFFLLQEPSGLYIDVANSFAPPSPRFPHGVLLLRSALLVLSIVFLVFSLKVQPDEKGALYLAYLTHLGLIISIVYQLTACMVTFHRKSLIQPNAESQYKLSIPVKIMWFLYFLSIPNEIMITILYWTLDYPTKDDRNVTLTNAYVHGFIALLLLIDGNIIARIPLRIKQVVAIQIYAVLYLVWTAIHAFSGLGDGDNSNDTDLLYKVIDWKGKPIATLITSLVIIIVLSILYILAWFLSLAGGGCTCKGGRRQLHNS